MYDYKYLIIGGGMTADAAVKGIREIDPQGSIGLVSLESDPPYNRPPLSKGLWKGKPLETIWRNTAEKQAELHLGRKILSLDASGMIARDDKGDEYQGEKILLASGGTPRRLPFGAEDIIYYRTLADYRRLTDLTKKGTDFSVIGGGFIGAEVAAALAMAGKKVTMLFPETGIGANMYPKELSQYLTDYYRRKGVDVLPGEKVTGVVTRNGRRIVTTQENREISVDGVIAGIGIEPNIELARSSGLQLGNGIVVDENLSTSMRDNYAAGDVAEFYNPSLDKRMRVEHEDNANSMGRQAGRNMAGASEPYHHLPYFYSDLFELGYEAVGELDSRLETIADWDVPFQKGIIYYLRGNRVRGVLLWNVWDKVPAARQLISKPGPFLAESLTAEGKAADWKIIF